MMLAPLPDCSLPELAALECAARARTATSAWMSLAWTLAVLATLAAIAMTTT